MLWWERGRIYHDAIDFALKSGYVDCYRTLHPDEDGFTLPPFNPNVRLDYVFADKQMVKKLRSCEVVAQPDETMMASDHFPLLATFEV
jgi:exonuclease III